MKNLIAGALLIAAITTTALGCSRQTSTQPANSQQGSTAVTHLSVGAITLACLPGDGICKPQ